MRSLFTNHASPGFQGLWPRRRSRTWSPRRVRPRRYSGGGRWSHTWRGTSRRCRGRRRRSCGDRRSRWRWSNSWSWSRRRCCWCGRWCWRRCSCRHVKSIYLVISAEVDPTPSNHTGIPLARAGHQLVRTTAGINNSPRVAVVRVQPLVALDAGHPDNRVVGSISSCHPWGASPALTDVPGESDGWWACRIDYIRTKFPAFPGMKSKVCSFTGLVSSRRCTS